MKKKDKHVYPAKKILLSYVIFGSFLGGFSIVLVLYYNNVADGLWDLSTFSNQQIVKKILDALLLSLLSMPYGILPAYFTAKYITDKKLVIKQIHDYIDLFIKGCLFTLLVFFFLLILSGDFFLFFILMCIGGFSSAVVGFFVIPKEYKK